MSDVRDVHDRVTALIEEAETHLQTLDETDGGDAADGSDDERTDEDAEAALRSVGREAEDLLTGTDPGDLLEAVGSGSLDGAERPESIPEALATSDEEEVVTLRSLATLAKLDDADADPEAVRDDLRDLIAVAPSEEAATDATDANEASTGDASTGDASTEDASTEDASTEDASAAGRSADERGEADAREEGAESESSADGTTAGAEEASGEGSSDATAFVDALRDTVETLREGASETREGVAGADVSSPATGGETTDTDGRERSTGVDGTMLSTLPSRDRPDVGRSARISTVRKRRRSNRE